MGNHSLIIQVDSGLSPTSAKLASSDTACEEGGLVYPTYLLVTSVLTEAFADTIQVRVGALLVGIQRPSRVGVGLPRGLASLSLALGGRRVGKLVINGTDRLLDPLGPGPLALLAWYEGSAMLGCVLEI